MYHIYSGGSGGEVNKYRDISLLDDFMVILSRCEYLAGSSPLTQITTLIDHSRTL